jgi:hypothetical protein
LVMLVCSVLTEEMERKYIKQTRSAALFRSKPTDESRLSVLNRVKIEVFNSLARFDTPAKEEVICFWFCLAILEVEEAEEECEEEEEKEVVGLLEGLL